MNSGKLQRGQESRPRSRVAQIVLVLWLGCFVITFLLLLVGLVWWVSLAIMHGDVFAYKQNRGIGQLGIAMAGTGVAGITFGFVYAVFFGDAGKRV